MYNIKIFCPWDLKFELYNKEQIELYVDRIPNNVDKLCKRIVMLLEPQEILNLNSQAIHGINEGFYNYLLTHNDFLLENCQNSYLFEFGTSWIKNYDFPEKKFSVSVLVGGKMLANGQSLRQKVWFRENKIINIKTNFFLSGSFGGIENYNNNPILGNSKAPLFDSQFHICIENTKRKNWFTEKLIDCFQTKTIPIYWGCPNIENWFDTRGMIIVDSLEDIIETCNSLTTKSYEKMFYYVEENYERSKKFLNIDDRLKEKIVELLK